MIVPPVIKIYNLTKIRVQKGKRTQRDILADFYATVNGHKAVKKIRKGQKAHILNKKTKTAPASGWTRGLWCVH